MALEAIFPRDKAGCKVEAGKEGDQTKKPQGGDTIYHISGVTIMYLINGKILLSEIQQSFQGAERYVFVFNSTHIVKKKCRNVIWYG